MARTALLIGSPAEGLIGPPLDVERVAASLVPRGFEIQRCIDQDATREGILHAYRALIDRTASGDAVLLYYSGHGARARDETYTPPNETAPAQRHNHFIVPMDITESCEGDFRGILSLELASLLGQLTARTRNVTVVFDCCHAAGMTRHFARLRPKSLHKTFFAGASTRLERVAAGDPGFPMLGVDVVGNSHAVRLMAALPNELAWEDGEGADAHGILTKAFLTSLEEAGDRRVTWDTIKRRVRELVDGQYPDVEGPSSRILFELEEADVSGVLGVESGEHGTRLLGGQLHGVRSGDLYLVMPAGASGAERSAALGEARVIHVAGSWSSAELTLSDGEAALPPGAQAFPIRRASALHRVHLDVSSSVRPDLETAIEESDLLDISEQAATDADDRSVTIRERDGRLHIQELADIDLIHAGPATADDVAEVVVNLERLATARSVGRLSSGEGNTSLRATWELEWGRVVNGEPDPLPHQGAMVFPGDHIFVRARNTSRGTLHISVFDVGLAGKVTLLSASTPSGYQLEPNAEFTLGYREGVGWVGLGPLSWPEAIPRDGHARPESLVVIVSDTPQDLRALESPGMTRISKGLEGQHSELERLVDQAASGRTRDLGAETAPPDVHYAVRHIRFLVDPTDVGPTTRSAGGAALRLAPPARDEGFLMDDRPDPSAAYRRSRGAPAPGALAIQLGEIVVHNNKALLSTDVRVDALVVTGGASLSEAYRAGTMTFEGIGDETRLPLDDMLVFHGPVHGFVDLAVWISRDDRRGQSLADLVGAELNTPAFRQAGTALAGLAMAAPAAGAVVVGLGAAATIASVAYRVLSASAGKTIGLYRTSLLANTGFNQGRTPTHGRMRAQDFSFWYQVTAVE